MSFPLMSCPNRFPLSWDKIKSEPVNIRDFKTIFKPGKVIEIIKNLKRL